MVFDELSVNVFPEGTSVPAEATLRPPNTKIFQHKKIIRKSLRKLMFSPLFEAIDLERHWITGLCSLNKTIPY